MLDPFAFTLHTTKLSISAWSVSGVLGPVLVNYIREYQIGNGVLKAQAYTVTMYIMVGVLLIGCVSNLLVKEVNKKYHYVDRAVV